MWFFGVGIVGGFRLVFRSASRFALCSDLLFAPLLVSPFGSFCRFAFRPDLLSAFRFVYFVWACCVGGLWGVPFLSARFGVLSGWGVVVDGCVGGWHGVERQRWCLRVSFLFVFRIWWAGRWRFVSFFVPCSRLVSALSCCAVFVSSGSRVVLSFLAAAVVLFVFVLSGVSDGVGLWRRGCWAWRGGGRFGDVVSCGGDCGRGGSGGVIRMSLLSLVSRIG